MTVNRHDLLHPGEEVLSLGSRHQLHPPHRPLRDLHLAITRFHICDLISHLAPILNFPFSFLQMWRAGTRGQGVRATRGGRRARAFNSQDFHKTRFSDPCNHQSSTHQYSIQSTYMYIPVSAPHASSSIAASTGWRPSQVAHILSRTV